MTTTTDPRAAAEEALALHAKATQGDVTVTREDEDAGDITYSVVRGGLTIAFVPEDTRAEWDGSDAKADADFIATAYHLTPLLARAVIEQADEIASLRAELVETRAQIAAREDPTGTWARLDGIAAKVETSGAELASLRAELEAWREVALAQREAGIRGSALRLTRALERLANLGFDSTQPHPRAEPRAAPLTEGEARKVWSEAMWQRAEDDTLETVAIRCIVAASHRGAIPPEVRAETGTVEQRMRAAGMPTSGEIAVPGFCPPVDVPPIVRRRTGVFGEPVTLLAGLHSDDEEDADA